MKRIIRMLARLYPAPWRARYGAEFDQLVEDSRSGWRDAVNVIGGAMKMQFTKWGYGRFTVAGVTLGLAISMGIAFLIPQQWRSEAVLRGPGDAASREATMRAEQNVMSRASLATVIQTENLYPNERRRMPLLDVIERMRHDTRMVAIDPPGSLSLQFEYPDKYQAQQVVAVLMRELTDGQSPKLNLEPIDTPSLPIDPSSTSRAAIAGGGLVAGMLGGLVLAYLLRRRQHSTTCPTCGHRMPAPLGNLQGA